MQRRTWSMNPAAVVLAGGVMLLPMAAAPARGQVPVPPPPGGAIEADVVAPGRPFSGLTAEVTVGRDRYESDNAVWRPWSSAEFLVARQLTGGSIGLGFLAVERFDRRDAGLSVDAYRALWPGAHGNVRAQLAMDAVVLPSTDLSAELYQGFTGGWEPSVGVRRLGYATPVYLASLAVGKYMGDRWYLRIRGTHAERSGGGNGSSGSGLVRRYLGSSREFVELAAGAGKEAVTAGISTADEVVVDVRKTRFVEVGGRKFVTRNWGVVGAGSFHGFEAIPGRLGARAGLLARF